MRQSMQTKYQNLMLWVLVWLLLSIDLRVIQRKLYKISALGFPQLHWGTTAGVFLMGLF